MGKKLILAAFAGIVLGLGTAAWLVRDQIPFLDFGDPVLTEERPDSRPKRLDRKQLARFEGQTIEAILQTLSEESEPVIAPPATIDERLLASLPDAPLPFPDDTPPADEQWLRDFVTRVKNDESNEPTNGELWRFNLALAALRIAPDQLPASLRRQTAPAPESDTFLTRWESRGVVASAPFTIGDFDGDGQPELIDHGGGGALVPNSGGGLIEVERDHGTARDFPGSTLSPCDFDGDGDLDLYVGRKHGLPDSLLRNEGDGAFADITIEAGLLAFRETSTVAWSDFDADGMPDLLVGSSDQPIELYHQAEPGRFVPVAWDLGLWIPRGVREIAVADFDSDGFEDFHFSIEGLHDRLYHNLPQERGPRRFEDRTVESGASLPEDGRVVAFDADGDGSPDMLSIAIDGQDKGVLRLFRHTGGFGFENVTADAGLAGISSATDACPVDLDNDGLIDLFVATEALSPNLFYSNRGELGFREVSVSSGSSFLDSPALPVATNLGGDGSVDLVYSRTGGEIVWLQATGELQSWVELRAPRVPPGTRVELIVRDRDWILQRIVRSFGPAGSMFVGIGEADMIESATLMPPTSDTPIMRKTKLEPNQAFSFETSEVETVSSALPSEN